MHLTIEAIQIEYCFISYTLTATLHKFPQYSFWYNRRQNELSTFFIPIYFHHFCIKPHNGDRYRQKKGGQMCRGISRLQKDIKMTYRQDEAVNHNSLTQEEFSDFALNNGGHWYYGTTNRRKRNWRILHTFYHQYMLLLEAFLLKWA